MEKYPVEKSTRVCVLQGGFIEFLAQVGDALSVLHVCHMTS